MLPFLRRAHSAWRNVLRSRGFKDAPGRQDAALYGRPEARFYVAAGVFACRRAGHPARRNGRGIGVLTETATVLLRKAGKKESGSCLLDFLRNLFGSSLCFLFCDKLTRPGAMSYAAEDSKMRPGGRMPPSTAGRRPAST